MAEERDRHDGDARPAAGGIDAPREPDVMGSLAAMPLTEILQNMDFAKRTGRALVADGPEHGVVHFEHGQVVRAEAWGEAGKQTGQVAVITLCCFRGGRFGLFFEHEPVLPNVERPTMLVLLDAMRVIDERATAEAEAAAAARAVDEEKLADDAGLDDRDRLRALEDGEITDALDAALSGFGDADGGEAPAAARADVASTEHVEREPHVEPEQNELRALEPSPPVEPPVPPSEPTPAPSLAATVEPVELPPPTRPPPLPSRRASQAAIPALAPAPETPSPSQASPVQTQAFVPPASPSIADSDDDGAFAPLTKEPERHRQPRVEAPPQQTHVRWTPRVDVGLAASFRVFEETGWWPATVTNLSMGGAFLYSQVAVPVGRRLELHVQVPRPDGSDAVDVVQTFVQIMRAEATGVGVRFFQLSADVAGRFAALINAALSAQHVEQTGALGGAFHDETGEDLLGSVASRERSVYDLIGADPRSPDRVMAGQCHAVIQLIARDLQNMSGPDTSRLMVLQAALMRLQTLWTDPAKRLRYDLRFGYVRAAERIAAANDGTGPSLAVLRGVWTELFPDRVRRAEAIMDAAPTGLGRDAAIAEADAIDPFGVVPRQPSQPPRPAMARPHG